MADLLSVKEAQQRIVERFRARPPEECPIQEALGRVLAVEVTALQDSPAFSNSSMDGFAVRAEDTRAAGPGHPVELRVVEDIPAGKVPERAVLPGQASRIMTGAPLPAGANAVVPVEDTDQPAGPEAALPGAIAVRTPVTEGRFVRSRGLDYHAGQPLIPAGRRLTPQDLGLIASLGLERISVYPRPRIALFSSGDELVQPGQPAGPGQIYDSNRFVLSALLTEAGAQVVPLGTARDDPQEVFRLLSQATNSEVDLIVTSAGVSVGAFDYVRQVIETHGSLDFWRVNIRPGKPLAFGSFQGIPLIGLPGNPVSSYVGCLVFVMPVIQKISGLDPLLPRRTVRVILDEPVESDGRESYLRAQVYRMEGELHARLAGHQGSGNLFSLVLANALLIAPSEVKSLPAGSKAEAWMINGEIE